MCFNRTFVSFFYVSIYEIQLGKGNYVLNGNWEKCLEHSDFFTMGKNVRVVVVQYNIPLSVVRTIQRKKRKRIDVVHPTMM